MIVEPKSSATILALADLADLSARQLEDGQSIEDVIETLRAAALAVRSVITPEENVLDSEMEAVEEDESKSEDPDEISA